MKFTLKITRVEPTREDESYSVSGEFHDELGEISLEVEAYVSSGMSYDDVVSINVISQRETTH